MLLLCRQVRPCHLGGRPSPRAHPIISLCTYKLIKSPASRYGKGISLVDPDLVRSILAALWIAAEPLRLWCGWYSNLGENIPWLVIFLVLTAAPQTAVVYYLMLAQQDLRAVDQAVQVQTVNCCRG